jgi:hypothetical protein
LPNIREALGSIPKTGRREGRKKGREGEDFTRASKATSTAVFE